MSTFKGSGATVEGAITAAVNEAVKAWMPRTGGDLVRIKLESIDIIYGGFVAMREATVSLQEEPNAQPDLVLKLDVNPATTSADMIPPVQRPQPKTIHFTLSVTNSRGVNFVGTSPNTAVARFAVLRGRQEIWTWPEIADQTITNVSIPPGETKTFMASWNVSDIVEFIRADLHIVARFVPSLQSAVREIIVTGAF